MRIYLLLAMAVGASLIGSNCGGSGVGDPCVPEDEYLTTFSGFSVGEVNVESRSFQCLTRVCLVNQFQGRVSCPYGQTEDPELGEENGRAACAAQFVPNEEEPGGGSFVCNQDAGSKCADNDCMPGGVLHRDSCRVPDRDGSDLEDRIQVPVQAQLAERQAHEAVYCSCRCDGPDPNARYCECPSGFACEELVDDLGLGKGQLAGSYCVKDGTSFQANPPSSTTCSSVSGELCGAGCEGCVEFNDDGTCKKEAEGGCSSVEIVERAADGNVSVKKIPRNWGGQCEGEDIVCDDDTFCCGAVTPVDPATGEGSVERVACSDVGVTVDLTDGTQVRACPPQ